MVIEFIVNFNIDIEGFKFWENGFKILCFLSFSEYVNEMVWSIMCYCCYMIIN